MFCLPSNGMYNGHTSCDGLCNWNSLERNFSHSASASINFVVPSSPYGFVAFALIDSNVSATNNKSNVSPYNWFKAFCSFSKVNSVS